VDVALSGVGVASSGEGVASSRFDSANNNRVVLSIALSYVTMATVAILQKLG